MNDFKFELNSAGVRELLKSEGIMEVCNKHATDIAKRCGAGFATNKYVGKNRVNVSIFPESKSAAKKNYKENILLKAIK